MVERNPICGPPRGAEICTMQALETLGLSAGGLDRPALDRAWRRFARTNHPDMCPGDPGACARFSRGREAYEALSALAPRRAIGRGAPRHRGVVPAPVARERVMAFELPALHPREWVA
jgi:hypothetical protein